MNRATSLQLRRCIDELDRLAGARPQEREEVLSVTQVIKQLQILQDTLTAGDAREIVFVCSEQIVSLGHSREAVARVGGLALFDLTLELVRALQKEAHASIAIQSAQHQKPRKMIHG
jgi:hypothetical protein